MSQMQLLRETAHYRCEQAKKGVRITVKDQHCYPRSRVVSSSTWEVLKRMSDSELDGSCVLELGIGTWASR